MTTHDARFHRHVRLLAVAFTCLVGILACEDEQAPAPLPAGIQIVSGDAQYTRKGTQLEEPVVVRVGLEDGAPAAGVEVQFRVTGGGGSLSRTVATTGTDGHTSVHWTMGPDTGANQMRITVADNTSLTATANATSSEYYCAEEDPTFTQKFFSARNLMMLTRESIHTAGEAGLVRIVINPGGTTPTFTGQSFANYPSGTFPFVVRDCAFSTNGDLFISWNHLYDEVMKVAADGSVSHFATLDTPPIDVLPGAELAMTPNGVLVGCDAMGPFYVTCRDTLFRFEDSVFSGIDRDAANNDALAMTPNGVLVGCDAMGPFYVTCRDTLFRFEDSVFSGIDRDAANNDALACHPASGDVYFIYKSDRRLYRVPFDGTTAGPREEVVVLDIQESDGAKGMVVDGTDGAIYILVEYGTVKSIIKVTSAGVKTTQYDFFARGAGDAAGIQSDLGIDRGLRYLFTLDTKNNTILLYPLIQQTLIELIPDGADPYSASNTGEGERVGLDVINVP